jgi:hypothetical protein
MPENFEFVPENAYVQAHSTEQQRGAVRRWQNQRLDYKFSFHTQHDGGWPCYLVELKGPGRHLPKINLKVPTDPLELLQGESVKNNKAGGRLQRGDCSEHGAVSDACSGLLRAARRGES